MFYFFSFLPCLDCSKVLGSCSNIPEDEGYFWLTVRGAFLFTQVFFFFFLFSFIGVFSECENLEEYCRMYVDILLSIVDMGA